MKYFTWNFDDGLEEDKKIIEILKENGMGATYNISAAFFEKTADRQSEESGI